MKRWWVIVLCAAIALLSGLPSLLPRSNPEREFWDWFAHHSDQGTGAVH